MLGELLARVRAEASGERARDDVAAVSRFHRVQSSPGYDQAAEWLSGRIEAAGLAPETEEVPGDGRTRWLGILTPRGWECAGATAVLDDGGTRETLCRYPEQPLSLVLRSRSTAGRHRLCDVGPGTGPEHYDGRDVRGCVVLASGPAHRVHRLAVVERGAAGILTDTRRLALPVRGPEDERDALNYTSFWWSEDEERGWGFVVTPETGDRLRARLAAGAEPWLEVRVDARDFATRVPLLSTRIGPAEGPEILVTAHLCHPCPSANDNGSGVAAALETARVLGTLARRGEWTPRRAVRFLWMPELTGTHAWIGRDPERASRTLAAINLDMVGQNQEACGSTFLLEHPPCFAASFATDLLARIRHEAQDWVESFSGPGHFSMMRMAEVPYSGGSDHVTWIDSAIGVPCPMLIQWPDRFYHSSHDTVEHTDPRSLVLAVRSAATYAGFLAAAGEEELRWLQGLVARSAERRVLAAFDEPGARYAVERERVRGRQALASLARLGVNEESWRATVEAFERQAAARGGHPLDPGPSTGVPVRRLKAPLDFQPHLWPGYENLTRAESEELRRLGSAIPGGSTSLDIAWSACDGVRSLEEIGGLCTLEHGAPVRVGTRDVGAIGLARFFTLTERTGLSGWVS